jgi:hypothetical protein
MRTIMTAIIPRITGSVKISPRWDRATITCFNGFEELATPRVRWAERLEIWMSGRGAILTLFGNICPYPSWI